MRLALLISLLILFPVEAENFNVSLTDLGSLLVNNTITQLKISQSIFMIFELFDDHDPAIYQNFWGIIYGFMVLQSVNNQITNEVLEAMNNESYTADMSYYGYGEMKLYDVVGESVNMLGASSEEVFGDPQGTKGVARIFYSEYYVLRDPKDELEYDYLGAYATEIVKTFYAGVQFFIKLTDAIEETFT